MSRVIVDLHVQHQRQAAQALGADPERVDLLEQLQPQFLGAVRRPARLQLVDVDRIHHAPLGDQHRLLGRAADAERQDPGRTPVRAHGRHHGEHPVDDVVVGQQHRELRLVLRAAAFRRDDHFHGIAEDELDMHHRRRIVAGALPRTIRVGQDRGTQLVVRVHVSATHAFVDHLLQAQLGVPTHPHADADEGNRDTRVLTDRSVPLGAHARVDEDLRHRVLGGGRLLGLVRLVQALM